MSSNTQSSLYPVPEKGSIRAALLANATRRLYTHPLEWKAEQLEHLSFELHPTVLSADHEIADECLPNFSLAHGFQWDDIRGTVADIQYSTKKVDRDKQMRNLIAKLHIAATGSQLRSDHLAFQYGGRAVAEIPLPLIFCSQQPTLGAVWAYIDGTWSLKQRHNFHRLRNKSFSYAMQAVHEAKNLPLDPLYVAILIALAQKARGGRVSIASKMPQKVSLFVPEHTITTGPADKQSGSSCRRQPFITTLKQYTATITDEYLQKFDDPYHYHGGTLQIHHEALRIGLPLTIYQALQSASRGLNVSLDKLIVCKKRKALEDTTELATNVKQAKFSRLETRRSLHQQKQE